MYTFLKKVVTAILPWGPDLPAVEPSENEETILNRISNLNFQNEDCLESAGSGREPLGHSDPVNYEVECFKFVHRTGRVTHLCTEYGLIDNVVYFGRNQVSVNLELKLNDEVVYTAYRVKENETERVHKVYALKNDPLGFEEDSAFAHNTNNTEKTEDILALPRVLAGRVTQRRGREVYVENADVWCNLDKIKASYVPVEGDWVELQAVVAVDEETPDWSGDVLEIRSLKPLLSKSGFGRVTFWSDSRKEGAIENVIYFTRVACEDGYSPALGDEVVYDAVESDQDRFRWRALKVLNNRVKSKISPDTTCASEEQTDMAEAGAEKSVISITPEKCSVNVTLDKVTMLVLEVKNTGKKKQLLRKTRILGNKTSHIKLVSPTAGAVNIRPQEAVPFVFECQGKTVGTVGDLVIFCFKGFDIEKTLEINVSTGGADKRNVSRKPDYNVEEADYVMYGPKPWKPPKFLLKDRPCVFNIPRKLQELSSKKLYKNWRDLEKEVLGYAPFLKYDLNFSHYSSRFHTLLYLEEIAVRTNFRKYDRKEVYLKENDKYFVLEVPGLVEKRPSLIVGDKVIVTQDWSEGNRTVQVGYIHEIHERDVFLKFHGFFHETYDGSECDVFFEPNTSFFNKAHDAVNKAERYLGEKWLFPSAVDEKPPQIQFEIAEEKETDATPISRYIPKSPKVEESPVKVKTPTWVNPDLNLRQKLSVVGILRGSGRPLPYIIFGPPGTGKTATMVEAIIQIYRLMPESRILITTPSNSAADLICERLIKQGGFQPGELVRLMAMYRVMQNLVPANLVPYCKVYIGKDKEKDKFLPRKKIVLASSIDDLAGRSRITVTTCSTSGQLYQYGFPRGHFSHIFVDEAGQTSEPEVLLSAGFLNTADGMLVLAGDPKQLGPVVICNIAKSFGLGVSLLERLISRFPYAVDEKGFPETSGFDPRFITKLVMNYRSVPEILSLPSQMFYNSDLYNTISRDKGREADIINLFGFKGEGRNTPAALIFHGIIGRNYQEMDSPSWFNPQEVFEVVQYLRKLYSLGLKSTDVGVITPYTKQVHKIRNLLPSLSLAVPKIGSVEEFQGQERHVIILSTVRSSPNLIPSDIKHSLGFVSCPQRLNVALTRARALLIIVGNPVLLCQDPHWVNVVKYCVENKSYTGCRLDMGGIANGSKSDDEKSMEKGKSVTQRK